MDIKAFFKTNTQRQLEAVELQMGDLFKLTEGVPGATLTERITNLLPPAPTLQPKTPPQVMATIEAVTAAGY